MSEENILEQMKEMCLSAAQKLLIPKKITLGHNKMFDVYKVLRKQILEQENQKPLTFSKFKEEGCQLNLGFGAMSVEFKDNDPDYMFLHSITEDQLLKQSDTASMKLISEENKLKNQGRGN